jgi:hypothetical protein
MGVDKTIRTACTLVRNVHVNASKRASEVVSSIDSSPEILGQAQVVIIPVIRFTLENKLSGMSALVFLVVYGQR